MNPTSQQVSSPRGRLYRRKMARKRLDTIRLVLRLLIQIVILIHALILRTSSTHGDLFI